MQRGEISGRWDVNYWASILLFNERYATPLYPLEPLSKGIAFVQYGCSDLANSEGRGLRIVRMNNLQADGWDFSDIKYVPLGLAAARRYRLKRGDVLFNRTNSKELVGKCEVFRERGVWVFASYLIRVRCNEKVLLPDFAAMFLNTSAGRLQIDRTSRQIIGMTKVNAEELQSLIIPLPDTTKQGELVAAMEAARGARRAKLAEADALLAGLDSFLLETLGLTSPPKDSRKVFAVRRSACMEAGRCDPGFHHPRFAKILEAFTASPVPKLTLGKISSEIVGGATPTKGSTELYTTGGIKFLRILNVKANEFDLSDLNYIKSEVHEGELKRSQLAENDVLMTIIGRVGSAAVVSADLLPANINQHIVRLRIGTDRVLPEYLAIYLNSSVGLTLSNRGVTGGTRVALDYSAIRALEIPVPSREVQDHIVTEACRLRDEARHLRTEAEADWQAAKRWFEEQLLGPAKP